MCVSWRIKNWGTSLEGFLTLAEIDMRPLQFGQKFLESKISSKAMVPMLFPPQIFPDQAMKMIFKSEVETVIFDQKVLHSYP